MDAEAGHGAGVAFAKGHGTANDFVLLPDPDGRLHLTTERVRALCDRRNGIGGDGVLRIVRAEAADDRAAQGAEWFMDYRNADGSLAQMCGNGIRVFVHWLVCEGIADPAGIDIATRGGVRHVARRPDGRYDVEMGRATPVEGAAQVSVADKTWPALGVHVPNPHAVAFVDALEDAGRLLTAPTVSPAALFPEGANIEFVRELAPAHVRMRVFERGVGETQSCGTGACAVAWAARRRLGASAEELYRVDVPGGTLHVRETSDGQIHLIGPADIVAKGRLDPAWWAAIP